MPDFSSFGIEFTLAPTSDKDALILKNFVKIFAENLEKEDLGALEVCLDNMRRFFLNRRAERKRIYEVEAAEIGIQI